MSFIPPVLPTVTNERATCLWLSLPKDGPAVRSQVTLAWQHPSYFPVLAGQELLPRAAGGGRSLLGRPVIWGQGVNPCSIKRLSIIKHFPFVRRFIVIFLVLFTSPNSVSELCPLFLLIKFSMWSRKDCVPVEQVREGTATHRAPHEGQTQWAADHPSVPCQRPPRGAWLCVKKRSPINLTIASSQRLLKRGLTFERLRPFYFTLIQSVLFHFLETPKAPKSH